MKKENWLLHTRVDIEPFVEALNKCKNIIDATGNSAAIGPKTKQLNYCGDKTSYAKVLLNTLRNVLQERPEFKNRIKLDNLNCVHLWTVEGQENSYHRIHRHCKEEDEHIRFDDCIATVLYINVPEKYPKGEFYCLIEKDNDTILRCFKPKVGDLFIFPWTLYHGVYPQGPGLRKTINCDFVYKLIK
jgi:hypothetical protein